MSQRTVDLTEFFVPPALADEIPRDALVRQIASRFGPECRVQMLVGQVQTGKTGLLAQFCRYYKEQAISYFITDSPLSQQQHVFLYSMCYQLGMVLERNPPPENIRLEDLKSLFSALCTSLKTLARSRRTPYYFVIDGLEWGLEGTMGDRIIDVLPLPRLPRDPYVLFSCRSDKVDRLPGRAKCPSVEPWPFSVHETQMYLADLGLSDEQIGRVHERYGGVPGYLTIIKQTKRTNPDIDLESAPEDLDRLVSQQLRVTRESVDARTLRALELLAASPVPLPTRTLADLTQADQSVLSRSLEATGFTKHDQQGRIEYRCDLIREKYRESLGGQAKKAVQELIDHIRTKGDSESLLLPLLLREAQDYEGLQGLLTPEEVLATVDSTGDISSVVKRLQLAAEMAREREDLDGLIKWTLGIAVAKSFVSHAVDQAEIRALLAIGETRSALRKAYSMPEVTSRIRLLARAYFLMKERGERVPKDAKEELRGLVSGLRTEDMDREIAQGIALDLLPVLPDAAITLLERILGQSEHRGLVELAIEAMPPMGLEWEGDIPLPPGEVRVNAPDFADLLSVWLHDLSLEELLEELKPVEKTKAKEYIIRQWCRQNPESAEVVRASELWLDAVEDDRSFVIPLRSLRHISEVAATVPLSERKRLIDRLKVPRFTAIDAPREEWIRLRLNLAEALFPIDPENASLELEEIRSDVVQRVEDLDEKAFCLARLKLTLTKVEPMNKRLLAELDAQFQQAFDDLRSNSAEQFEAVHGILRTLVDIDPADALIVASELNTRRRRIGAFRLVLTTALRRRGQDDISQLTKDALDELERLDVNRRDVILAEVTNDLRARGRSLSHTNLDTLLTYAKAMRDPALKARTLANVAVLYNGIGSAEAAQIMEQALGEWREEEDLKVRLSLGFRLVELMSRVDPERAREFCDEVKQLQSQPGSSLAAGALGAMFREVLDLAIRSTTMASLSGSAQTLQALEHLIGMIPARRIRIELCASIAATAYRVGHTQVADELVRTKVVAQMNKMPPGSDRDFVLRFSLPVIFEYDPLEAESLAADLPSASRNRAWYSVVRWSLSRSFLGDHYFEPEHLRVPSDRPRLQATLQAVAQIQYDYLLYRAISAVAEAVQVSFDADTIDLTQALDTLTKLDADAESELPDRESIGHEGYLVVAQAVIHRVRSVIVAKSGYKRGLRRRDIRTQWHSIESKAKQIPNTADRIFVMALVAQQGFLFQDQDPQPVKHLLTEAYDQVPSIPTLIDRVDRLETISESWRRLGEGNRAEFVLSAVVDQIEQLEDMSFDARLSKAAELAYKLSADFADELVSRVDTRRPEAIPSPAHIALLIQKVVGNPAHISKVPMPRLAQGTILRASARKLLDDFAAGRGVVRHISTLEEWLTAGQLHSPGVSLTAAHWVVESLCRKGPSTVSLDRTKIFFGLAELIYKLTEWISPARREGVPVAVQDSFPGLNSRVTAFQAGERERATKWVQDWLSENASGYLKICDPYFGPEQLDYLKYVPPDCKVLVVTTDRYLHQSRQPNELRERLKLVWSRMTSQALPQTQMLIVPRSFEDKFHDRAIISSQAGLDIGQSLNGLGKSHGKITILSLEEAKELETTYLDNMLNQATWFMQHGVNPTFLSLGCPR